MTEPLFCRILLESSEDSEIDTEETIIDSDFDAEPIEILTWNQES